MKKEKRSHRYDINRPTLSIDRNIVSQYDNAYTY